MNPMLVARSHRLPRRRAGALLLAGFIFATAADLYADGPIVEPRGLWVPPERFYPAPEDLLAEAAAAAELLRSRTEPVSEALSPSRPGTAALDPGVSVAIGSAVSAQLPESRAATAVQHPAQDAPAEADGSETADATEPRDGSDAAVAPEAVVVAEPARPVYEIPVLGELDLEAFSIAPRALTDAALVVAFYGHPRSSVMGILGEYPLEQMARKLMAVAKEYDDANGDQAVLPAFHIVYATVFENADVGILNREILQRYIDFAEEHGFAIFLDHQLGRHDVVKSVESMLPFLRYESVHLAIDPEWSTLRPGKEIGSVTAAEINEAQQVIQDYLIDHDLPGNRMLIVHQFNRTMIQDRGSVRTDFERVRLVHNADGFGTPAAKIHSWQYNVLARNIPEKGFKLFYPKSWRDGGFDYPLMSVQDVLDLTPTPAVIMYQ